MSRQAGWGLVGGIALSGIAAALAALGPAADAAVVRPVVFASGRDGAEQIQVYRMDESGQNQKAVTTGPGYCLDPVLSPDGKQILFSYLASKQEQTASICVINVDGTGRKQLSAAGSLAVAPSWSPDGKRILYTAMLLPQGGMEPSMKLHVMDADGKNDTELTDGIASAWSADGKSILYTQFKQGDDVSLHLIGVDGTNPRQLTPSKSALGVFSPDGKKLAYLAEGGGNQPDVFVADADGKNPVQITKTEEMEMGISWSADGKKLFYSRFPRLDDGERSLSKAEIFSTDLEGKSMEQLTTNDSLDALAGGFLVFGIIRR